MTIHVFLDTEFTDLINDTKLISIGLVTAEGERTFYAELTDSYQLEDCSHFVKNEVIPLLDAKPLAATIYYKNVHAQMTLGELNKHLNYWFAALQDSIQIWTDAPNYDWRYIQQIFSHSGMPFNLLPSPNSLLTDDMSQNIRFQNAVEEAFNKNPFRQHHALDDALANRIAWLAVAK